MGDLVQLLPMPDEMAVIKMTGNQVLLALENGVCKYPRLEGRFPQVSGVTFSFNPDGEEGDRVLTDSIKVNGSPLDIQRDYSVCIKAYLLAGKDGYTMFPGCPILKSSEEILTLPDMVRLHFTHMQSAAGTAPQLSRDASFRRRSSVMVSDALHGGRGVSFSEGGVQNLGFGPRVEGRIINTKVGFKPVPQGLPKRPKSAKKGAKDLTIVHFNDVYNIEGQKQEPVGGVARFASALDQIRNKGLNPLVLFSGDAFNPSIMSTVVKGVQMPPCLNALGIHTACYGNHDFDFGLPALENLASACEFPWLISNAFDKRTNKPLGNGLEYRIFDWDGYKIGIMGLIENEWLDTLGAIDPKDVVYTDFVHKAKDLDLLMRRQGCEMVIALTHMRVPNDHKLAQECPQLDLILGGHDHHYEVINVNGRFVFKSGTDFRDLTRITVRFTAAGPTVVDHEHIQITSAIPEDPTVKQIVDGFTGTVSEKMDEILVISEVDLDARFSSIRSKETNIGNFVADVLRMAANCDVVILNSGTLRSDTIHPAGPFKMCDLMSLIPMCDEVCVIGLSGEKLLAALENGVSKFPALEGRFPQVSGVSFKFDPSKSPNNRIVEGSVKVGGVPLDLNRTYEVLVLAYLMSGKDGYTMFTNNPIVKNAELLAPPSTMLRNHFSMLTSINQRKYGSNKDLRQSLVLLQDMQSRKSKSGHVQRLSTGASRRPTLQVNMCPVVEGRIVNIANNLHSLLESKESMEIQTSRTKVLTILHFSDVRDIDEKQHEPVGGAARFCAAVEQYRSEGLHPLVFFSGGVFSPSTLSTILSGTQMLPCLNELGINAACLGNHDLDFGLEVLETLTSAAAFPWIVSNAVNEATNQPIGNAAEYHIFDWGGCKIGVLGLIERESVDFMNNLRDEKVLYTDFVEAAQRIEPFLREQGCEVVIALTHMEVLKDKHLCSEVPEIDLILGGRDLHYDVLTFGDQYIFKSGSNFCDLSKITVTVGSEDLRPKVVAYEHVIITGKYPENAKVKAIVEDFKKEAENVKNQQLAVTKVDLDAQKKSLRSKETNLGNFVCDVLKQASGAECVILNSGTFKSDSVLPAGPILMSDLVRVLPTLPDEEICVIEVSGAKLLQALENGVSQLPTLKGRFPQVSGLRFTFDSSKEPFSRVNTETIHVSGMPLSMDTKYKICVKAYVLNGMDGYTMFRGCPILSQPDALPPIAPLVKNYFASQNTALNHGVFINPQVEQRIVNTSQV